MANAANAERVGRRADRAGRGVRRGGRRTGPRQYALIAVQGPRALEILATPGSPTPTSAGCRYYAGLPGEGRRDGRRSIARTGYTGEDGFELFVAADDAVPLWQALTAAGEPYGLRPAGLAGRDTLRLEAGMPLYGNELTTEVTPFDAGLGRVVDFDKPRATSSAGRRWRPPGTPPTARGAASSAWWRGAAGCPGTATRW